MRLPPVKSRACVRCGKPTDHHTKFCAECVEELARLFGGD